MAKDTNNGALALAILGLNKSGGGGGEPSQYLKSAAVSEDGNTLTLTKKDGSEVEFSPETGSSVAIDGKTIVENSDGELETAIGGWKEFTEDVDVETLRMYYMTSGAYTEYYANLESGETYETVLANAQLIYDYCMEKGYTPGTTNIPVVIKLSTDGTNWEDYNGLLRVQQLNKTGASRFWWTSEELGITEEVDTRIQIGVSSEFSNPSGGIITIDDVQYPYFKIYFDRQPGGTVYHKVDARFIPIDNETIVIKNNGDLKANIPDAVSGTNDGTNWTSLTIGSDTYAIPEGGGSSEGAVRYDEAQTLTDSQKNQAKANLELPYISNQWTSVLENHSTSITASNTSVYIYGYSEILPKLANVGTIIKLEAFNNSTGESLGECSYKITDDSGSGETISGSTTGSFFMPDSSCFIYPNSYFKFWKLATSSDLGNYVKINMYYYEDIANNKFNSSLIDSLVLENVILKKYFPNESGYWMSIGDYDSIQNRSNTVIGQKNVVASDCYNATILGYQNRISTNVYPLLMIGKYNTAGYYMGEGYTAPQKYNIFIGERLRASQSENCTIIGVGNEKTSKYLPYDYNATYNTGDCVTAAQNNYESAVWRCKQDNTKGKYVPSSRGQGNEYWDYVDDGHSSQYIFVIGNGDKYGNARSNALSVTWDGTLECKNIPAQPTSDGNYVLKCSIVDGVATYSWVAE